MFRSYSIFFIVFLLVQHVQAQDPAFTHYPFNWTFYNSALTGLDESHADLSLTHRSQWLGYDPTQNDGLAPTSQLFSMDFPLNIATNRLGFGFYFLNDMLGQQTNVDLNFSMAYHIKLKVGLLSFGMGFSAFQRSIGNNLRWREPGDPLDNSQQGNLTPDFHTGVSFDAPFLFLHASVKHLSQPLSGLLASDDIIRRQYNFGVGSRLEMGYLSIIPQILVQTDLDQYLIQPNINMEYKRLVFARLICCKHRVRFHTRRCIFRKKTQIKSKLFV